MNLKNTLLFLLTITLVISCNQDEILEQSNDQNADLTADIRQYDETNYGLYKGTFTTLESTERGIVEIKILENAHSIASLKLISGETIQYKSSTVLLDEQIVTNLHFVSVNFSSSSSFDFSVDLNGNNPKTKNVSLGSEMGILKILKETSRAPVVPISGVYLNPSSSNGTLNMVFNTGTGAGNDIDITTTIMVGGLDYGQTLTNVQDNCSGINPVSCDINGTSLPLPGGGVVTWTGTHAYNTIGDCSEASGTWISDGPEGHSGTFFSDAQCTPPVNDLCGAAIGVICGDTVGATTAAATTTGEPSTWCGTTDPAGAGIWYSYLSTGGGNDVTVNTCGSDYDTKLFVYLDGCGTLTCLTGNDDSCGTQSSVGFNEGLIPGVEFLIYAAGWSGATGALVLNVSCVPPPPPLSCGDDYIDDGGPLGDYATGTSKIDSVDGGGGNVVTIAFTEFSIEAGWDFMYFYDGTDILAPQIMTSDLGVAVSADQSGGVGFTGTDLLADGVTSTGQFLTVQFISDASFPDAGWVGTVSCAPPAPLTDGNGNNRQTITINNKATASPTPTEKEIAKRKEAIRKEYMRKMGLKQ